MRCSVCPYFSSIQCIIKQLLDSFFFCDVPNNQGLGYCYRPRPSALLITLPRPLLFRISQKSHPILVQNLIGSQQGLKLLNLADVAPEPPNLEHQVIIL